MGRRAALLRLHLPQVSPFPHSIPALKDPQVTHRFPGRAGSYIYDSPQTSYANQYLGRFDQQLTHLDLLTGRVFVQRSSQTTTWGNLPWTIYATPYAYLNI